MANLFPVADLRDRYSIGKQAELNRRKHLGIKPFKIEGTYYITEQQLKTLDALDHWLTEQGGKMADFDPNTTVDSLESSGGLTRPDSIDSTPTEYQEATLIEKEEPEAISPDWYGVLKELADNLQPARSPIQNWRELEEACEKGWLLTTKQVQELAGAKPKGSQWQRGSFIFTRAGKIGNQGAWLVEKKV
jgi:hypothetical protein